MLRTDVAGKTLAFLWIACGVVGALAACLVLLGNPRNMGICGACFLRDSAGALGLFTGAGPRIFRPELTGLVLGAFLARAWRRNFEGRAGSFAGVRFFLGLWMGIGAMVFLGCPFRMLQRIGGGDLHAVVGLVGFVLGVGVGKWLEGRGYSAGKTMIVITPAGLPSLLIAIGAMVVFLLGWMPFPATGEPGPAHAPWGWALGLSIPAGLILSLTGFCAVSAARQVFSGPRRMLIAAAILILGYAIVSASTGLWSPGFGVQPIAHADPWWNVLAMALVGLTGVMAGGCPVRLIVLSGEGNGDALVTAVGVLGGAALSHSLGLASTSAGPTLPGQVAVSVGLGICLLYGVAATWARRP